MELYFAYDFIALIVAPFMRHTDQCLYNALVLKIHRQPIAYLLKVRDALLNVCRLIEDEVAERQVRAGDQIMVRR